MINKNMEKKTFKILSIDGGGIKGLYSASILASFESKTGKKITDYFDMICGTSTGGLIAIGLANGMSSQALVDLYTTKGSSIFPTSNSYFIRGFQNSYKIMRQLFFSNKHSVKPLKRILEDLFGDKTMNDSNNLLCIPSFNLTNGQPKVFKKSGRQTEHFVDNTIKLVDIALATSAAPSYYPIHKHNNFLYTDGGVWANNPSLCGLLEALDYYVGEGKEFEDYSILSISSITTPNGWVSTSNKSKSIIGWKEKMFQTALDGQSYFTDYFLLKIIPKINPKGKYIRIKSPELSKAQMNIITMDRADKKTLKTIQSLGSQVGNTFATKPEILNFFKTIKNYKNI
jgi:patatin-like phospholipase/acyl hydrolase